MKRKTTIPVMWISLPNNTLACACSSIQWNGYSLLPAAGYRSNSSGAGYGQGSDGYYWSAEAEGAGSPRLSFYASSTGVNTNPRADGFTVRCVQEFTEADFKIRKIGR